VLEETTMLRRTIGLIVTLALGFLVVPLAVEAQPVGKVYRIGFRSTDPPLAHLWEALLDGLRERGYREGQNLVFERRFSEGHAEHLPELAAELVRFRVDCLIVTTTPAALAAKHATQTVPIVMTTAIDPVGAGLVASLARPGGNLTGLSGLGAALNEKRLELLQEVVPSLTRVAVLWNAANPANAAAWHETQAAAHALGLRLLSQEVRARRTSRARSLAWPRRARRRSSSCRICSSGCTDHKSLRSPPSSTCRACLPAGHRSWTAV
jgi:putative ABC transport system substrate-binding protein